MASKRLVALLSSLISELLLLLLLLFPSSSSSPLSLNFSNSNSNFNFNGNLFATLHYFLSSQEIATSITLLTISKKRKRTHLREPDSDPTYQDRDPELGHRLSGLDRVVTRNPDSFRAFFRMSSSSFEWLCGLLEPLLECRDPIPLNLSAELRLGTGLFRLATGSSYTEIAQKFGVSESVTRFCAKQLCRVLCTNFRFWVAFPTDLESVSRDFEALSGLPNCCGVITCARFKLFKEDDSIAVQIVVDSSSRILSIVAGIRGDRSDFSVLKSTTLFKDVEEGRLLNSRPVIVDGVVVNQYLVGDEGYPLLPWLMVPFADADPGSREEKFNVANKVMRVSAPRTSASLKSWGVFSKPIDEEFKTAVAFIGACSILHNALLIREDDSALIDVEDHSSNDQGSQNYGDDALLEDNLIRRKASDMRNVLAAKVKEFREI